MILTDEVSLRLPCSPVTLEEVAELRQALEQELKLSAQAGREGVGLAAPQIGIYKTMAIIRIPIKNGFLSLDLVNAKIQIGYDLAVFEREGCLSFPGKTGKTKRFQEIHVVDNLVEPHNFIVTGLPAVVIQHELDHLRGILLPDLIIQ